MEKSNGIDKEDNIDRLRNVLKVVDGNLYVLSYDDGIIYEISSGRRLNKDYIQREPLDFLILSKYL